MGNKALAHMELLVWYGRILFISEERPPVFPKTHPPQTVGWGRIPPANLSLYNSCLLVKFKPVVGHNGDDGSREKLVCQTGFILGASYSQLVAAAWSAEYGRNLRPSPGSAGKSATIDKWCLPETGVGLLACWLCLYPLFGLTKERLHLCKSLFLFCS